MARESKRKREAKRFGVATRVADLVNSGMIAPPNYIVREEIPAWEVERDHVCRAVERIPVINADNVASYAAVYPDTVSDWFRVPATPPPFDSFLVEASGTWPLIDPVVQIGVIFSVVGPAPLARFTGRHPETVEGRGDDFSDRNVARATWRLHAAMGVRVDTATKFTYPIVKAWFLLCESGEPLVKPIVVMPYAAGTPLETHRGAKAMSYLALNFCLLALAFMNCKNVSVTEAVPDAALNRLRAKAGLKPFLRYHTIDIEPMKKVLRTEGNVETEGLKRALHICRGHFATYTEERPLFGRVAGTFWVPAHTRGSLDRGVIVSDYRVHPPGGGSGG